MTNSQQYVIFKLEDESYGVPIKYVKTIEKVSEMTRVPNSDDFLEGVINLRGEVVPIINMRTRFHLEEKEHDDATRIIILEMEDFIVGIIVDSSYEVIDIENDQIDNAISMDTNLHEEHITGIGKVGERMVIIVDIIKVLYGENNTK